MHLQIKEQDLLYLLHKNNLKIKNVIDIYSKLETNEQKNILLRSILEKVTYLKTEKAIKKDSNPSNFEIHIYPKIPKLEQQQNKKIN